MFATSMSLGFQRSKLAAFQEIACMAKKPAGLSHAAQVGVAAFLPLLLLTVRMLSLQDEVP